VTVNSPKRKAPAHKGARASFYALLQTQKAKGEEKPEEELMGKRKSSPRLATTPLKMLLLVV
jgi:hypothetical protein